jgi:hypothetical protein
MDISNDCYRVSGRKPKRKKGERRIRKIRLKRRTSEWTPQVEAVFLRSQNLSSLSDYSGAKRFVQQTSPFQVVG